jgi:hypothetical protein
VIGIKFRGTAMRIPNLYADADGETRFRESKSSVPTRSRGATYPSGYRQQGLLLSRRPGLLLQRRLRSRIRRHAGNT